MIDALIHLLLFTSKAIILVILILFLIAGILALFTRGKEKQKNHIIIKNLNDKYHEVLDFMMAEISSKKDYKKFIKEQKQTKKTNTIEHESEKNVYVLHFDGDMKASAVNHLREEITAILTVASPKDEVVVCLESAGGVVHGYGLATSQLLRIKEHNIPLTIIVDKIAASGGYMMACVADKILAAPFAIIGSIGVIFQLPNFNRYLKEKNIDFEQVTAGSFKRTLTLFGHNTEEAREKLREELEDMHKLFKQLIAQHRKHLDIEAVSTGEHWMGSQALSLGLVDELKTSDDYLMEKSKDANLLSIKYHMKKSITERFTTAANAIVGDFLSKIAR